MFTEAQTKELSAKLSASHVKGRKQSGRMLSYLEGWHVIAEANRIFGFDAWTRETVECRCVSERERKIGVKYDSNGNVTFAGKDGWGVSYVAKVRVIVAGIAREGFGAGHGIDTDLGLAHESAIKEAETDAMKRALMTFGNPFGLALYDKSQENVSDEPEATHERAAPNAAVERLIDEARQAASSGMFELQRYWNKLALSQKAVLQPHMPPIKLAAERIDEIANKAA